MRVRTRVAGVLRAVGLGRVVASSRVRALSRVAPGTRARATPAPASSGPTAPTAVPVRRDPVLTVVVPVHDVEEYVEDCLRSVLDQSFDALEVVVVDDGSTDRSAERVAAVAATDPRVRLIRQANAGLGAARNAGVRAGTAPFLTFVDSDDLVLPGAYAALVGSLRRSGSDVAVGAIERFDAVRSWTPRWVPLVHGEDRIGITGTAFPPIAWDVFAWNKVYRRTAWDTHVGAFPEGTLYEDQECTAKLFVRGARIDVLRTPVYRWRLRERGSITQQKTSTHDLTQRLAVAEDVLEIIAPAGTEYVDHWFTKLLGEDLYYYVREVPRVGEEYWELLVASARAFWERASEAARAAVPVDRRWLVHLTARGDRAALEAVLEQFDAAGVRYRVEHRDGGWHASLPFPGLDGLTDRFPPEVNRVDPDGLPFHVELEDVRALPDGAVELDGVAYVEHLAAVPDVTAWVEVPSDPLDPAAEPLRVPLAVTAREATSAHLPDDRRGCGVTLRLTAAAVDAVAASAPSTQAPAARLVVQGAHGGATWRRDRVRRTVTGPAGRPAASAVTAAGSRVAVVGDPGALTELVGLRPRFVAEHLRVEDGVLDVAFRLSSREPAEAVRRALDHDLSLVVSRKGRVLARIPLDRAGGAERWSGSARLPDAAGAPAGHVDLHDVQVWSEGGLRAPVALPGATPLRVWHERYAAASTAFGYAQLASVHQHASVARVEVTGDGTQVAVRGTYVLDPASTRQVAPTFALVGQDRDLHPVRLVLDAAAGTYEAVFDLERADADGRPVAVASGRYVLEVLLATGRPVPPAVWVTTDPALERTFPATLRAARSSVGLEATERARALVLRVGAPVDPADRTRPVQEARARAFLTASPAHARRDTVLLESFGGAFVADSPLALDRALAAERPDLRRCWTVADGTVAVPDGATPLLLGSPEWYEVASTASLLVNNNNFPGAFVKQPWQTYVQTWHGTPLKRIGEDVPAGSLSLRYRALMRREAGRYWDVLLAQSPWAADRLRGAFRYDGPVFDDGYPRDDALVPSASADARRTRIRRHLGIGDGQRAVLYAPTWRDYLKDPGGRYSRVDLLRCADLVKTLGPDVVVLLRSHANAAGSASGRPGAGVLDVTMHPDVNDLVLASDVLVTDYSSTMFDYAVTGKPIVLHVPDLERYRDEARGFYVDIEAVAPGPVLRRREDVVEAIRDLDGMPGLSSERYAAFVRQFAPRDDGGAARRFLSWWAEHASSAAGELAGRG